MGWGGEDCGHIWNNNGQWNDSTDYNVMPGLIEILGGPFAPISGTLIPTTFTPLGVAGHSFSPLPNGGGLLFGGTTANGPQVNTYTLSGTVWSQQFPFFSPTPRTDAALLQDGMRGNNLLFGGRNPIGTALNDTWTFSGGQWTYLPLAITPSPRSEHRMAFDSVRQLGILFGGKDASGAPLADQWLWNGTSFSVSTPATVPPARFSHGLAYDSFRLRTVLFGGQDATALLSDVWEYDGLTWSRITPTSQTPPQTVPYGPSARAGFGMAYDPRAERVFIIGGDTAAGCVGDAFSWDGADFTRHNPGTSPMPTSRHGTQLFYNPTSNQLNLFAGGCGTTYNNDLWSIDLPVFWRSSTFGVGCQGSNGLTLALNVAQGSTGTLGHLLQCDLANVPVFFSISYGQLGFNKDSFNGLPLPLDLGIVGLPGCTAMVAPDLSFPLGLPNSSGTAVWNLNIPNQAFLLGMQVYLQGLSFEAPGFSRWASVSNGLTVRIGNY